MNRNIGTKFFLILGLILSSLLTNQYVSAYTQNEAELLIEEAEKSIIDTYIILWEAEKAGANVIPILNLLNSAANRLNQEKIILNEGISEQIIIEIEATITLINDLSIETSRLNTIAISEKENAQRSILLFSSLKIILFIVVMYLSWLYYKSLRGKRIMSYRPEIM